MEIIVKFVSALVFSIVSPRGSGPEPHSSAGSIADLRTGGHWFDPRLGQYSFRGLMIVIVAGLTPLSTLFIVSTMVMWESS